MDYFGLPKGNLNDYDAKDEAWEVSQRVEACRHIPSLEAEAKRGSVLVGLLVAMVNTKVNKPNGLILIILLLCFLNVGGLLQCGSSVPREYREFLALPRDKQREEIKKFPLEKQVDIYAWGLYSEPPNTSMADEIAKMAKKSSLLYSSASPRKKANILKRTFSMSFS